MGTLVLPDQGNSTVALYDGAQWYPYLTSVGRNGNSAGANGLFYSIHDFSFYTRRECCTCHRSTTVLTHPCAPSYRLPRPRPHRPYRPGHLDRPDLPPGPPGSAHSLLVEKTPQGGTATSRHNDPDGKATELGIRWWAGQRYGLSASASTRCYSASRVRIDSRRSDLFRRRQQGSVSKRHVAGRRCSLFVWLR